MWLKHTPLKLIYVSYLSGVEGQRRVGGFHNHDHAMQYAMDGTLAAGASTVLSRTVQYCALLDWAENE